MVGGKEPNIILCCLEGKRAKYPDVLHIRLKLRQYQNLLELYVQFLSSVLSMEFTQEPSSSQ